LPLPSQESLRLQLQSPESLRLLGSWALMPVIMMSLIMKRQRTPPKNGPVRNPTHDQCTCASA
jgi:hypothetical protein